MNEESIRDATRLLRMISDLRTTDKRTLPESTMFSGYSLWLGRQYSLFAAIVGVLDSHNAAVSVPTGSGPTAVVRFSVRVRQFVAMGVTLASIGWLTISRGRFLLYDLERNNPVSHSGSRIKKVYELIQQKGVKYGMLIHSLSDHSFWPFLLKARCPIIYAESVHLLARFVARIYGGGPVVHIAQWRDVPHKIRPLVERELRQIPAAHWSARLFFAIGRIGGLRGFIAYDDMRHTSEMLIGFTLARVRTIVVQHGNFNYFAGLDILPPKLSIFPDYFCVASLYWSRRLPQLSSLFAFYRDRLRVTGWLGSQRTGMGRKQNASRPRQSILIPYELLPDYRPIQKLILTLIRNDYTVVFKLKPGSNADDQLRAYDIIQKEMSGIKIIEELNEEVLNSISAAVGVYSTLLDEMILSSVPVGIIQSQFPVFDDKVDSGIANSLELEGDVVAQVQNLCEVSDQETERRRLFYEDTGANADVAVREIFA